MQSLGISGGQRRISQLFFTRFNAIVNDVETQIEKVKHCETLNPEHDLNINLMVVASLMYMMAEVVKLQLSK